MECYICLEGGDDLLKDICACNTCVHTKCLFRWINQSKNHKCSICKTEFKGVVVKAERNIKFKLVVILFVTTCGVGLTYLTIVYAKKVFGGNYGLYGYIYLLLLLCFQFCAYILAMESYATSQTSTIIFDREVLEEYALRV